jgi:hypothetical protein
MRFISVTRINLSYCLSGRATPVLLIKGRLVQSRLDFLDGGQRR